MLDQLLTEPEGKKVAHLQQLLTQSFNAIELGANDIGLTEENWKEKLDWDSVCFGYQLAAAHHARNALKRYHLSAQLADNIAMLVPEGYYWLIRVEVCLNEKLDKWYNPLKERFTSFFKKGDQLSEARKSKDVPQEKAAA